MAVLIASGSVSAGGGAEARSHEVLEYSCSSDGGEQRLTLFGNGTVRLRERSGGADDWSMKLVELTPDELGAYRARLRRRPYDQDAEAGAGGPSGEWIEQCLLRLEAGPDERREYRFSRIESLPLDLAHLLSVADELVREAHARSRVAAFPPGYEPRRGDVLLRADGSHFRIERFTGDGDGVELTGIDSPLVLYVERRSLVGEFVGLAERGGRP